MDFPYNKIAASRTKRYGELSIRDLPTKTIGETSKVLCAIANKGSVTSLLVKILIVVHAKIDSAQKQYGAVSDTLHLQNPRFKYSSLLFQPSFPELNEP